MFYPHNFSQQEYTAAIMQKEDLKRFEDIPPNLKTTLVTFICETISSSITKFSHKQLEEATRDLESIKEKEAQIEYRKKLATHCPYYFELDFGAMGPINRCFLTFDEDFKETRLSVEEKKALIPKMSELIKIVSRQCKSEMLQVSKDLELQQERAASQEALEQNFRKQQGPQGAEAAPKRADRASASPQGLHVQQHSAEPLNENKRAASQDSGSQSGEARAKQSRLDRRF